MDKSTWSKILSILFSALVALAMVAGYDIAVMQPRQAAPVADSRGTTNFSAIEADVVTEAGTPVARLSGSAINAASLKVGATAVALVSGSAITGTSLSVNSTPVALLSGSTINATALSVGATPVALLTGSTLDETAISVGGTPVALQVGALAAGQRIVCGSTTITGTGTIPHGLSTPSAVMYSLAQDTTADGADLSHTNASAVVTIKVWSNITVPVTAATTPVAVDWCVNGKP